tara:strand:- start:165 stop:386 length:222 start_codon:yes stop_codon:yes gene_type:complete
MITDYIKYVNDEAYVVKRETPIHMFVKKNENTINMELLQSYRDYLGCNHVLRSQTHFLMCEAIAEAEIIEDEN